MKAGLSPHSSSGGPPCEATARPWDMLLPSGPGDRATMDSGAQGACRPALCVAQSPRLQGGSAPPTWKQLQDKDSNGRAAGRPALVLGVDGAEMQMGQRSSTAGDLGDWI